MLYATVRQRKIHVKNPVTVIRSGIGVDWLILDMDDEWREMNSIVCVFTNGETAREMLHTFGQPVQVPWECLTETGLLSVSCTGYVGSEKVMTTMMPDSFWNVVQNGPVTGDTPMEPTPTLYEQVLAAAGAANSAATQAAEVSAQLMQDKENAVQIARVQTENLYKDALAKKDLKHMELQGKINESENENKKDGTK